MDTETVQRKLLLQLKKYTWLKLDDIMDELADASEQEKEAMYAGLEFECWLLESCNAALKEPVE